MVFSQTTQLRITTVIHRFLANNTAENNKELDEIMLESFKLMGFSTFLELNSSLGPIQG